MAYKIFFLLKRGGILKDIGAKLKETRESMEISVDEAAKDLKVTTTQLEEIEEGKMETFKDILYLKYFIRDYSKYLGLDYNELVDEFNEYLFDYTSKISIKEIKEAKKEASGKNKDEDKVVSPYTLDYKSKPKLIKSLIVGAVIIVLVITIIWLYVSTSKDDPADNNIIINEINVIGEERS